jgi:bacillithiol biosynthesis cysteine-adding enzyme BshC
VGLFIFPVFELFKNSFVVATTMSSIFSPPTQNGSMKLSALPFSDTGYFSKLVTDYTSRSKAVAAFSRRFAGTDAIAELLEQPYRLKIDRSLLSETILHQYDGIDISEQVLANTELLRKENAFCVVTAHQLNLFGGPLYFVIKIANTISLSRKLQEQFPDKHFVPVYWMGSEDHDFEEVNHIRLFGKTLTWDDKQGGAFGRYTTKSLQPLVEQLKEMLGVDADRDGLMNIIETAYSLPNIEQAARYLVNALFGVHGLVIVNGDDPVLKAAMKPVFAEELFGQASEPLVQEQSLKLETAGYHAQASPRPINLFYLSQGKRERIERLEDGSFVAGELRFSVEELKSVLEQRPEAISPNVILRPVFQQSVLPAVAFIGGGGELAYWMQLPTVFDLHGASFPVLVPRTSLMYLPKAHLKRMEKLGLDLTDLFKDKELLKKAYALKHSKEDPDLSGYKQQLEHIFQEVRTKAEAIDATLGPASGAEAQKAMNALDQLQGRMIRAIKQQQETSLRQIDHLYEQLFPDGVLQERKDNFMNFYARQGQLFIDLLIESLMPIEQQFVVLQEGED